MTLAMSADLDQQHLEPGAISWALEPFRYPRNQIINGQGRRRTPPRPQRGRLQKHQPSGSASLRGRSSKQRPRPLR